ncbi:MAG: hypothetical protein IJX72_05685 [Clostridia bacterium]|nr:hypothetical protein [Clostridia bacterium]
MIYKAVGCLLLLLAGGYVSFSVRRFEHRRLRVLDGYISLIYYVKGQIDCYAMPLGEILARADPAVLSACLGLDRPVGSPFSWGHTVGKPPLSVMVQESHLYLAPETERLLNAFTGELGSAYRTEQVARCDYYIQALTEERRKLYETMPARLRACGVLCLCCAIGAGVRLW